MPYDQDLTNIETTANSSSMPVAGVSLVVGALLSACGGQTSQTDPNTPLGTATMAGPPEAIVAISEAEAARFLCQASMGATREQIARVQSLGYSAWLEEQFNLPLSSSRWDWLISKGMNDPIYHNSQAGFDSCAWRKLISSPDTLRQRITLALSEICVISIDGLVNGGGWKAFAAANYLDLLEANCFGNYRDVLQRISTSTAMSLYLTYRGNTKYNAVTGAFPDENYAREVMQLFSIGLLKLNPDGTPIMKDGIAQETYTIDDITGLARIFTGWDFDLTGSNTSTPDYHRRPLIQIASKHESGASTFLGATIPAGISGDLALKMSLDVIFAHANVAPFISRQLIQRLVTSNPSPAYVGRVSAIFNNNGLGGKGDLRAVIKAILLDDEARRSDNLSNPQFGKIREPMLRMLTWARAFNAKSPADDWRLGNTSDAGTKLGQSPLRSPTVFNYFRPGYVPPNTSIASAALVAPEMQIVSESSVVGYVNFMQTAVNSSRGVGDLTLDYSSLLSLADDAGRLVDELNLILAAKQISSSNRDLIRNAINGMASGSDSRRYQRIYAALTLVLAAPEFIVLK